MKSTLFASFAALVVVAASVPAAAHSILVTPPPIGQDDSAKSGPCGCYFGAGPQDPNDDPSPSPCPGNFQVTTLQAGTELKIQWKETINHDGAFRFAFSPKTPDATTKADMDAGVLVEVPDTNNTNGTTLSQMVNVPNEPCELCTIQLRQFMMGAANPYYYSCAAVKIVAPGGTGGGGAGGSGAGGTTMGLGGNSGGDGQGATSQGTGGAPFSTGAGKADPPPEVDATCSVNAAGGGAGSGALAIVGLSIAAALVRRRRRG